MRGYKQITVTCPLDMDTERAMSLAYHAVVNTEFDRPALWEGGSSTHRRKSKNGRDESVCIYVARNKERDNVYSR